ncbi:MAG: hypothetical protein HY942_04695 [Gammaproteobacteria bacterium]|nr:hypothetical protein [Gammaproteobacteria bacterium]
MKRIGATVACLLPAVVTAHPGHPSLNVEHAHAAHELDPLLGLMLIVAAAAAAALVRAIRRRRSRTIRR